MTTNLSTTRSSVFRGLALRRFATRGLAVAAIVTLAAACGGAGDPQGASDVQSGGNQAAEQPADGAVGDAGTVSDDADDAAFDDDVADNDASDYFADDDSAGNDASDYFADDDSADGDSADDDPEHRAEVAAEDAGTVSVIISNGPDAGTYEATGPVGCNAGVWSAQHWDMQYQNDDAQDGELRAVLLNYTPEHADDPTVGFNTFSASVSVGPYVYPDEHVWDVVVDGPNGTSGNGTGQLVDSTITAEGTTPDGIEFTIFAQCSFGL